MALTEQALPNDTLTIFDLLIGSHVWNGTRSFGTYLTFEFGSPHTRFREPRQVTGELPSRIDRAFQRRKVDIVGDWSLWLQECDWELHQHGVILTNADIGRRSTDANLGDLQELLRDIDGQKLIVVSVDEKNQDIMFHFDLGGEIRIRHSVPPEGPQWSLHSADNLIFEKGGQNG